mgnify:CR=1 FL=1
MVYDIYLTEEEDSAKQIQNEKTQEFLQNEGKKNRTFF